MQEKKKREKSVMLWEEMARRQAPFQDRNLTYCSKLKAVVKVMKPR